MGREETEAGLQIPGQEEQVSAHDAQALDSFFVYIQPSVAHTNTLPSTCQKDGCI